ncbi:Cytochrome P450 4c3, partial [Operophtera brumata]
MLVLILFCVTLGAYWMWRKKQGGSDEPPSTPGGWPLVGHAHLLVVVTDPDDALTVANACLEKDKFYDFAKPWLGEIHRKLLQPAFSQTVLDGFLGVFNSQSRKLVHDLEIEAGKGPFDHWTYTRHNALETICCKDHSVLNQQYVDAAEKIFYTIVDRFQKFWLHSPWMFQFSGVKRTQDACLKKIIGGKIKLIPFMDLLLELAMEKGVFTDKEIRDHVDTMIVGGHDTSANVLMFTLILLGSHTEVQKKVFEELEEVFEGSDRDVEKADLLKLVYLEAVLKESMRLYTINKMHHFPENCTLSSGRTCFIFVFGIHRHPMWGPDVDQFRPERWLSPATLPESSNAFAAFMMGRRSCIGKSYAYMSMKTTLSHVLRRYSITANHKDLVLKLDVMLKPATGYHISIDKRESGSCGNGASVFPGGLPVIGHGLLFIRKGVVWKRNRRILDLAFKQPILDSYQKVFNNQAIRLDNTLSKKVGVGYVDVTHDVTRSVLETTC